MGVLVDLETTLPNFNELGDRLVEIKDLLGSVLQASTILLGVRNLGLVKQLVHSGMCGTELDAIRATTASKKPNKVGKDLAHVLDVGTDKAAPMLHNRFPLDTMLE